ncbi:MAG: hypothetical protein LQ352_007378 [Teloschistes flavicans]|nr:MAG: hypothetical protein LQ352_007378 [Teloschistes flavicans]
MSPLASAEPTTANSTDPHDLPANDNDNNMINIVFGLVTIFISAVMIWENRRVLKAWLRTSSRGYQVYELAAHMPQQHIATSEPQRLSSSSEPAPSGSEAQRHSSSSTPSARIQPPASSGLENG